MAEKKASKYAKWFSDYITSMPMGPRIKKWAAEYETQMRALRKLKPDDDAFNDTVKRLWELYGCLRSRCDIDILEREIVDRIAPSLPEKAARLEQVASSDGCTLSLSVRGWPTKTGWDLRGFASVDRRYGFLEGITVETLSDQVVAVLRQEAEALNAMANEIERHQPTQPDVNPTNVTPCCDMTEESTLPQPVMALVTA